MLLTYARLQLKLLLAVKLLRLSIQEETFFGFTVRFFDYRLFVFLFEEIFVWKPYHFEASTQSPTILDCGSNIGMSVLYFKMLYPECAIVAFEPDTQTFALFRENVFRNKLQRVTLVKRAVSDNTDPVDFYYDQEVPGSLRMTARAERGLKDRVQVESTTLSGYLDSEIDFLKMDIEGAEASALKNLAQENKLRLVKEMVFEYHHHEQPDKDELSGILATLEQAGFGYEISAFVLPPLQWGRFHGMLIYAYRK
jgi:FkbM family methyltransferase